MPKKPLLNWIEVTGRELEADKSFAEKFSVIRMGKEAEAMLKFLFTPGARDTEKDAALMAYDLHSALAPTIHAASPPQLRALRLAYEAGQALTESWHFQSNKAGRKKLDHLYEKAFDSAVSKWRIANPISQRQWPTFKNVALHIMFSDTRQNASLTKGRALRDRYRKYLRKRASI